MPKIKLKELKKYDHNLLITNIRRLRAHLGISRQQIWKYTGVTENTLHLIEAAKTKDIHLNVVHACLWIFNQLIQEECKLTIEDLMGIIDLKKILKR